MIMGSPLHTVAYGYIRTIKHVTEFEARDTWRQAAWNLLMQELSGLKNPHEIKKLLALFVTPLEQKRIVHRMVALVRLQQGKSYREIGRETWVSPETISALKKSFQEKQYRSRRSRIVYKPRPARGSGGEYYAPQYRQTKYGKMRIK